MDTVEQIKQYRKVKSSIVSNKLLEALKALERVERENKEIYVNGESEDIKSYCNQEITKVKIKKVNE